MDESYVDQGAIVDDFLNSELVFQDSDEVFDPVPKTNAETAEKPVSVDVATEPEVKTEAPTETAEKETAAPVATDDPFSFIETAEDGSERFNPISALDFITRRQAGLEKPSDGFKYEPAPIEAPKYAEQQIPSAPDYETNIRSLYFSGFDYVEQFVKQGYSPEQALILGKQAADTDLKSHLYERNMKEMENRLRSEFEEKKATAKEQQDIESLRPISIKNLHELSKNGYQSIEQLQKALLTPGLGGGAIQYFFDKENAGRVFKSVEERANAMQNWFVKFSADKQGLMLLEEITRARIAIRAMPELIKAARSTKENTVKSNTAGKSLAPVSAQNKTRTNPATRQPDSLEQFLGGSYDEV